MELAEGKPYFRPDLLRSSYQKFVILCFIFIGSHSRTNVIDDYFSRVQIYAKAVPYPHGTVIGEELFQSGVLPSDTDFRIFRDYGHLKGIMI